MTSWAGARDRLVVRPLGFASFFLLVVGGLLVVPSTLLAAPKVAVIETKDTAIVVGAKNTADWARGRREIVQAVSTAVEQAGGQIVVPAPLVAEECASQDCVKRVGSASGATYVLVIDAAFDQDSFKLHLDMWGASSGDHLDGEGQDCDGCSVNDLTKALRDRTTLLCDRVFRAAGQSQPVPLLQPPAIVAPPTAPLTPAPVAEHRTWPLWTIGAGGAALVAGLAVGIFVGERSACANASATECFLTYDYRPLGYTVAGVGAVAAVAGAYFLLTGPSGGQSQKVSLAFSPAGLSLGGSF